MGVMGFEGTFDDFFNGANDKVFIINEKEGWGWFVDIHPVKMISNFDREVNGRMNANSVAVRVFRDGDDVTYWKDVPIVSYIPIFISGPSALENISKRVHMLFLRDTPDLVRARWHYRGSDKGVWVTRDFQILEED